MSGNITKLYNNTSVTQNLTAIGVSYLGSTGTRAMTLPTGTQADYTYDQSTPVSGWIDIPCDITARGGGANNPAWSLFRNGIYAYEFPGSSGMKEVWATIHIPHTIDTTTGVYLHTHWAPNTASSAGDVKWNFEYTYASSNGVLGATSTTSVVTARPATYTHTISEISAPILAGSLEVDGIILIRCYRDAAATEDTSTDSAFLFFIDCHIQVNKFSTKNRNKAGGSFYT